jgi:hypothetical protein
MHLKEAEETSFVETIEHNTFCDLLQTDEHKIDERGWMENPKFNGVIVNNMQTLN